MGSRPFCVQNKFGAHPIFFVMGLMDNSDWSFGPNWLAFRPKNSIFGEKAPKTCLKCVVEVLDRNGGGPGRVF